MHACMHASITDGKDYTSLIYIFYYIIILSISLIKQTI